MKKTLAALLGAFVLTATTVLAGEGPGCTGPTQGCLDHLSKSLSTRGWVGVELEPMENGRMTVLRVVEDSPAEAAGLKKGDVLISAEGLIYCKSSQEEWSELMGSWAPSRTVTYKIERDGTPQKLRLTLGELPPQVRHQLVGAHMLEHAQVSEAVN